MKPLRVTAQLTPLGGSFIAQEGAIAFDALLAAKVAEAKGLTRLAMGDTIEPIEIPLQREPAGRFHLASWLGFDEAERRSVHYVQRRFPLEEVRRRTAAKQVNIGAGVSKNYRIPHETVAPAGGRLVAYCVGDEAGLRRLLTLVTHLGRRRAVGQGRLLELDPWRIEEVEPWSGFPLVRDRRPLRPLPLDWPGLDVSEAEIRPGRMTYPYWWRDGLEELAWPIGAA